MLSSQPRFDCTVCFDRILPEPVCFVFRFRSKDVYQGPAGSSPLFLALMGLSLDGLLTTTEVAAIFRRAWEAVVEGAA